MVWQRYPKTLFLIFHFLRYFAHVQHLRKSNLNIHSESPFIKEWHCICNFFYVWLQCSPLTQDTANFVFPGRHSEAGKSFERIQFFTGFSRKNSQSLEDTQVGYLLENLMSGKYTFGKYIFGKWTFRSKPPTHNKDDCCTEMFSSNMVIQKYHRLTDLLMDLLTDWHR